MGETSCHLRLILQISQRFSSVDNNFCLSYLSVLLNRDTALSSCPLPYTYITLGSSSLQNHFLLFTGYDCNAEVTLQSMPEDKSGQRHSYSQGRKDQTE